MNNILPNYNSRSEKKEWEKRLEVIRAIRDKNIGTSLFKTSIQSLLLGILKDATDLERILEYFKKEGCYKKFGKRNEVLSFYQINPIILDKMFSYVTEINKVYVGQILICDKLKLDLNNGDASYNKTPANFKPGTDEYNLLCALMKKPNQRIGYDDLNKAIGLEGISKKGRRDISTIVRNIKSKLKITGENKKNKNIFTARNGYMIVCK